MKKKLHKGIILVILTLFVVSATIFAAKAAFSINFSPLSGAPGDSIGVSSLTGDFKALTTVGIGFGAEVAMTNEAVTVTETGINSAEGFTANHPIKPGSFSWSAPFGALTFMVFDNGDGTLYDISSFLSSGIINYTSGFFSRTVQMGLDFDTEDNFVNYTTYENDVTPEGASTSSSGFLIETITVPPVPNGTYAVTAIDEVGNVGTGNFQVVGSDIIPEPLTVGAIVLLSSTAVMVSLCWLRKKNYTKNTA